METFTGRSPSLAQGSAVSILFSVKCPYIVELGPDFWKFILVPKHLDVSKCCSQTSLYLCALVVLSQMCNHKPAAHDFGWRVDSSDQGSPLHVEPGRSGWARLGFCLFLASGCLLVWQSFNCIFKLHDELPGPIWEYPSQNDVGFNAMKPAGTKVIKCSILLVNTWEKGNK